MADITANAGRGAQVLHMLRQGMGAPLVVMAMLALTLGWPTARDLFRFGPLHADDLAVTVGVGLVVLLVLELAKPSKPTGPTSTGEPA